MWSHAARINILDTFLMYAPGLYWKITWPPLIHTFALKIVPLVVRVYSAGFVKCFDIAVFCFILNQSGQLWIKEKTTIFCWFECILQSFKLSLLTGLSKLWLYIGMDWPVQFQGNLFSLAQFVNHPMLNDNCVILKYCVLLIN